MNLLLHFAVVDIWGFLPLNPYWLLRAFGKTPNINHATTTGLESAGEKQLNPTVRELIKNLRIKDSEFERIHCPDLSYSDGKSSWLQAWAY